MDPNKLLETLREGAVNPLFITALALAVVGALSYFLITTKDGKPLSKLSAIIIFAALALAIVAGGCGILLSILRPETVAWSPIRTYHGYYGDLGQDNKTTIQTEKLSIQFAENNPSVRGTSAGDVSVRDKIIHRIWKYSGVRRDEELVLTFVTTPTDVDPNPTGIGTNILVAVGNSEFTGMTVYKDCVQKAMVQCPYALTEDDISADAARARWPKLFAHECKRVDSVEDNVVANSARAPKGCKLAQN
jgi:hypothetical protein